MAIKFYFEKIFLKKKNLFTVSFFIFLKNRILEAVKAVLKLF